MTEPSQLTRTFQEFADMLRALTRENLTEEERATMRAVRVEIDWLLDGSEMSIGLDPF